MRGILGQHLEMGANEFGPQLARLKQRKSVAGVQALVGRREASATLGLFREFAHHEAVGIAIDRAADFIQRLDLLDEIAVVPVALQVRRMHPAMGVALRVRHRWIVGERRVVEIGIGDVETETVDAAGEPFVEHRERGGLRRIVAPVELGLLAQEFVMVVLPAHRLIRPGRPGEGRQPVVRHRAVVLRILPDIPIRFLAALQTVEEPGVFVGGMREHFIGEHLQPARMRLGQQPVEIRLGAVVGMNAVKVRDVITPVAIG